MKHTRYHPLGNSRADVPWLEPCWELRPRRRTDPSQAVAKNNRPMLQSVVYKTVPAEITPHCVTHFQIMTKQEVRLVTFLLHKHGCNVIWFHLHTAQFKDSPTPALIHSWKAQLCNIRTHNTYVHTYIPQRPSSEKLYHSLYTVYALTFARLNSRVSRILATIAFLFSRMQGLSLWFVDSSFSLNPCRILM